MWYKDAMHSPGSGMLPRYTGQERRVSARIETPFPATVRSVGINGQPFEVRTILDNVCSRGVYLRLVRQVQQGIKLFVFIRLSVDSNADAPAACVALHGVVLRVEPRPGGAFGIAIGITHYRFIYATERI